MGKSIGSSMVRVVRCAMLEPLSTYARRLRRRLLNQHQRERNAIRMRTMPPTADPRMIVALVRVNVILDEVEVPVVVANVEGVVTASAATVTVPL
jgi:hypothetical protein